MARVTLVVANIGLTGVLVAQTTGTADDMHFANTGREFILVTNTGIAPRDVSIMAQGTTAGGADYEDETVSVTNGTSKVIGPFETAVFNTSGNLVEIDLDAGNESDLDVQAFKFFKVS